MSATLCLLGSDETATLAPEIERAYAEDIERSGGIPRAAARRKAAADVARVLTDESSALYAIEADGERVGRLWVAERELEDGRALWIYEVFVEEEFRGRGFGRDAMRLAEDEARQRGVDRIALNVFGANDVARRLYRSLGYDEVALMMRKDVA